jgi:hypothetical protein
MTIQNSSVKHYGTLRQNLQMKGGLPGVSKSKQNFLCAKFFI